MSQVLLIEKGWGQVKGSPEDIRCVFRTHQFNTAQDATACGRWWLRFTWGSTVRRGIEDALPDPACSWVSGGR